MKRLIGGTALLACASVHAFTECDNSVFLLLKVGEESTAVMAEQIDALPQHVITTSTHWAKRGTYKGPKLADVLNLVKPTNPKTLYVYTWDNFRVRIPYTDLAEYGVILSTSFNGKRLKLDDWGPTFIMYPYEQRKELKSPNGLAKFAWQVCRIDIQ